MSINWESLGWERLDVAEKLALVERLWDDLMAPVPPGGLITDAQRDELRRRVADAEAHLEDSVAWEDALAATLKRLAS